MPHMPWTCTSQGRFSGTAIRGHWPCLAAGHRLLRPMHSWTVLVLATTAAFLAGALFASAGPRLGASVAIATAVHGRGPSNAGWHLRSLFQVPHAQPL